MFIPNWLKWTSFIWTLLFIAFCLIIPIVTLFTTTFGEGHEGATFFADPHLYFVVQSTLTQALLSTGISAVVGLVLGVWIGSITAKNHSMLGKLLLSIPFGVPSTVSAMAWIVLLGRSGIFMKWGWQIDWIYSLKAIVLAHVFLNIPLVTLFVAQARHSISSELLETAQTLGARFFSIWRDLIWPEIKGAFFISATQVFCLCLMSFSLVLVLGGGPPQVSLETELFQRLKMGSPDWNGAVHCALLEFTLALIPWIVVQRFQSKTPWMIPRRREGKKWPRAKTQNIPSKPKSYFGNYFILIGIPLLFLIPYSALINQQNLSLLLDLNWMAQLILPIQRSIFLATASSLVAILTTLFVIVTLLYFKNNSLFKNTLEFIVYIPNGVSALVLGLGAWLAYGHWFDFSERSWIVLILLQMTLFFPFSFRLIYQTARGMDLDQLEAATCLGASPLKAFLQVEWNRWKVPLFVSFSGIAAASLGEVAAASLFCNEEWVPLPLLATRWMMQYRFEEAEALSCLLLLLSLSISFVSSLLSLGSD